MSKWSIALKCYWNWNGCNIKVWRIPLGALLRCLVDKKGTDMKTGRLWLWPPSAWKAELRITFVSHWEHVGKEVTRAAFSPHCHRRSWAVARSIMIRWGRLIALWKTAQSLCGEAWKPSPTIVKASVYSSSTQFYWASVVLTLRNTVDIKTMNFLLASEIPLCYGSITITFMTQMLWQKQWQKTQCFHTEHSINIREARVCDLHTQWPEICFTRSFTSYGLNVFWSHFVQTNRTVWFHCALPKTYSEETSWKHPLTQVTFSRCSKTCLIQILHCFYLWLWSMLAVCSPDYPWSTILGVNLCDWEIPEQNL